MLQSVVVRSIWVGSESPLIRDSTYIAKLHISRYSNRQPLISMSELNGHSFIKIKHFKNPVSELDRNRDISLYKWRDAL